MSSLTSKSFWSDTVERIVRTAAQVELSLLTVNGANIQDITAKANLSAVGLSAVICLLTCVIASGANDPKSASFVK